MPASDAPVSGTREKVAEGEWRRARLGSMRELAEWDRERLGYRFVKRAFDIVFSACVIAVAIVPSAVLCAAIAIESPGCPLYRQRRVGRIGRFIRRHSIDEFPQFVNVLLGDMSVVGPRPPLPEEVAEYDEWAMQRLAVKPGLTGPWQVGGRSDVDFDDMVRLDLGYIARRSVAMDLKIILQTIAVVFTGKGAA